MPYIILEDKKGFKKTHGWEHYPVPNIRVAVTERPNSFSFDLDDVQFQRSPGMTTKVLIFDRDIELCKDVWLYKEHGYGT